MDAEQLEMIIAIGLFLVIVIAGMISYANKQQALEDPDDNSALHLDELVAKTNLQSGGEYLLRVYRQSGNLQKDDQIFDSYEAAIKNAVTTFKRAKIEFAFVTKNTEVEYFFQRPYYHHGGAAEGKKVGRVEIYKVS